MQEDSSLLSRDIKYTKAYEALIQIHGQRTMQEGGGSDKDLRAAQAEEEKLLSDQHEEAAKELIPAKTYQESEGFYRE